MKTTTINLAEFEDACESYLGWCAKCCAFTRESCEPDAERYECPECDAPACYGAEQALIIGMIDIGGGE